MAPALKRHATHLHRDALSVGRQENASIVRAFGRAYEVTGEELAPTASFLGRKDGGHLAAPHVAHDPLRGPINPADDPVAIDHVGRYTDALKGALDLAAHLLQTCHARKCALRDRCSQKRARLYGTELAWAMAERATRRRQAQGGPGGWKRRGARPADRRSRGACRRWIQDGQRGETPARRRHTSERLTVATNLRLRRVPARVGRGAPDTSFAHAQQRLPERGVQLMGTKPSSASFAVTL